jgi:hypothetical protein
MVYLSVPFGQNILFGQNEPQRVLQEKVEGLFVGEEFGGPERNAGEVPKPGSFFVFVLLFGVVSVNGVFREIAVGGGAAG